MSVREIDRFLEQWQMGVRDLHGGLFQRRRPGIGNDGTPCGCWPKDGQPRPRRMLWNGTLTPSTGGRKPRRVWATKTYRIHNSAVQSDLGGAQPADQQVTAPHRAPVGPQTSCASHIGRGTWSSLPCLMKSAMRSPIVRTVTLMLARTHSGMIEASTTRRPSAP